MGELASQRSQELERREVKDIKIKATEQEDLSLTARFIKHDNYFNL